MNYSNPYTGNPFNPPPSPPAPKQRNYAEVFVPEDYENRTSIDLESYARNLHNYLNSLLKEHPFPEFLFEKLEKRLDGITSILQKRSRAASVSGKQEATKRLQAIGAKLDALSASPEDHAEIEEPAAKRSRPNYVKELVKTHNELKELRKKYGEPEEEEGEGENDTQPL